MNRQVTFSVTLIAIIFGIVVFLSFSIEDKTIVPASTQLSKDSTNLKQIQPENRLENSKEPIQTLVKSIIVSNTTKPEQSSKLNPIKQCDLDLEAIDNSESGQKYTNTDEITRAFKKNPSYHSQLAFAIVSSNEMYNEGNSSINALKNLIQIDPQNKLTQYLLVSNCSDASSISQCSTSLIDELTLDKDNAALWFKVANFEAAKDDLQGFVSALKNAISAPTYNEYWAESIELFDQALLENGYTKRPSRMMTSIAFAGAQSIQISEVMKKCKAISTERADIAQLCIDTGVRIASQAKTMFMEQIGYAMQIGIYETLGNNVQADSLKQTRKDNYNISPFHTDATMLTYFDEELADFWFNSLKIHGEKKAAQLLVDEAIRLSSNPDYNPCPAEY